MILHYKQLLRSVGNASHKSQQATYKAQPRPNYYIIWNSERDKFFFIWSDVQWCFTDESNGRSTGIYATDTKSTI